MIKHVLAFVVAFVLVFVGGFFLVIYGGAIISEHFQAEKPYDREAELAQIRAELQPEIEQMREYLEPAGQTGGAPATHGCVRCEYRYGYVHCDCPSDYPNSPWYSPGKLDR